MILEKTEFQLLIINKIKNLREQHKVSQAQISDIIGLNSVGQVGNIESPKFKHKYTLEQIYVLAVHFNYPVANLFLTEEELGKPASEIIDKLLLKIIAYNK